MFKLKDISCLFNTAVLSVSALICVAPASNAHAAEGFVKGQVEFARTHSAITDPAWGPPNAWFTLKGVSQAGGCAKWYDSVLFVVSDKQALAFVLTAQASNQEVAVFFRDTVLVNGWCVAAYITIGSPAPLR
ncbi:MAG: hypothetical protein WKG03_02045 [Telluria sp.]